MSEQRLYIRVRGRVSGPFSLPQLRTLRDRGQFRRFHEVSPDRVQWTSAASLTDLFAPERAAGGHAPLTFPELEEPVPAQLAKESGAGKRSSAVAWHYVDANGNPQGPVPQAKLLSLWQQDLLPADTLVWREGLADWIEITAPETGLGLVAPSSTWGLPLGVWIAILAAVACLILVVLGYALYKWGERSADGFGGGRQNGAPATVMRTDQGAISLGEGLSSSSV
jgi:hypothetical protein